MKTDGNLGFTFQEKAGEYIIFHHSKRATTLRGGKAIKFTNDIEQLSFAEQQQLMARLTGNYKRGNERTAKRHPKNR